MPNRTPAAVALAATIALVLAGCVQQPPRVLPTATPSVAPVFKTDAEALAAAEKTYIAYSAIGDAIGHDGGKSPERVSQFVTKSWLPTEISGWKKFEKTGNRFKGSSSFDSFTLQQRDQSPAGVVKLAAYVCADIRKTSLLNRKGRNITPSGRSNVFPIVVRFESAAAGSTSLLVAGSDPWSGKTFC